ncbi:MAG TPA: hypothetical protein VHX86_06355 [Tepidisphaeraceae bacterium]|nr:hypothetical protein [Tepidisphaeraceae bacterium]
MLQEQASVSAELTARRNAKRRPHWIGVFDAQDRGRTIADSTEKSSDSAKGAAKSAAIDPELAELVSNWNTLPVIIKSAILAVARQHSATGKQISVDRDNRLG